MGHDKLVIGAHDSSGTDKLGFSKLAYTRHWDKFHVPAKKPWTVTTTSQPPMLIQPTQKLYSMSAMCLNRDVQVHTMTRFHLSVHKANTK